MLCRVVAQEAPECGGSVANVMTAPEYRSLLSRLGLTFGQAAKVCGMNDRAHRRYADGTREIPEPVARLLAACERWPGLLVELRGE